ncbi:hypothetical protein ACHQM5_013966 [Ranunculus cassubicifolius]
MEESKLITLGKSKLVPSVIELAKQSIATPPLRYQKFDKELPVLSNPTYTVPVIDMKKLLFGEDKDSELQKLHSACIEWGFLQLINHGVETELIENVKQVLTDFFELPENEKRKYWQNENEIEGYGQAFIFSDEQKLDWADMFFMTTRPVNKRKPHLFPKLPLPFQDTFNAYSTEVHNLAMTIFKIMEKVLHLEEKEITGLFEDGFQSMRMNYYPPCPQPEKVIGLAPHSDPVGLTVLLQVNGVEGLQIRREDVWVPIDPLPNAFIVNIGDILQIITNGLYRSIEHRAVVNSMKERLSIATFCSPSFDSEMGPATSLVTQDSPALYKRINVEQYFKIFYARKLDGKSYLDFMKTQNEKATSSP